MRKVTTFIDEIKVLFLALYHKIFETLVIRMIYNFRLINVKF